MYINVSMATKKSVIVSSNLTEEPIPKHPKLALQVDSDVGGRQSLNATARGTGMLYVKLHIYVKYQHNKPLRTS